MAHAKRIFIFISLIVFTIGNIGVGIYTHSCKIDGTKKSLFADTHTKCATSHLEIDSKLAPCCKKKLEKEKDDCCKTDKEYVKLNIDLSSYYSSTNVAIIHHFTPVIKAYFSDAILSAVNAIPTENYVHPPPKKQGRNLQSIHQVYVI